MARYVAEKRLKTRRKSLKFVKSRTRVESESDWSKYFSDNDFDRLDHSVSGGPPEPKVTGSNPLGHRQGICELAGSPGNLVAKMPSFSFKPASSLKALLLLEILGR